MKLEGAQNFLIACRILPLFLLKINTESIESYEIAVYQHKSIPQELLVHKLCIIFYYDCMVHHQNYPLTHFIKIKS